MDGLGSIWPATRTQVDGQSLGDAWPCECIPGTGNEKILPFHKLTQWLCYSLMAPMTKLLNVRFAGLDLMTGLPEYRNGGLLVDTGLLTLNADDTARGIQQFQYNAMKEGQPNVEVVPLFAPDDDVIVEWRALTVGFLDLLLVEVNKLLGLRGQDQLSLPQMLEAGTWKVSSPHLLLQMFREQCSLTRFDRAAAKSPKSRGRTRRSRRSLSSRTERCSRYRHIRSFLASHCA